MKKEESNIEAIDFIYTITLKNQLINAPTSYLIDSYKNIYDYISFLEYLNMIIVNDNKFFLIDEKIYKKTIEMLDAGKKFNNTEINNIINTIINALNILNGTSRKEKEIVINDYIKEQQKNRNIGIDNNKKLLQALAYDGIVLSYILNDLDSYDLNPELTVSSINYLINNKPNFFKSDTLKEKIILLLKQCSKNGDIIDKINSKKAIYKVKKEVI